MSDCEQTKKELRRIRFSQPMDKDANLEQTVKLVEEDRLKKIERAKRFGITTKEDEE